MVDDVSLMDVDKIIMFEAMPNLSFSQSLVDWDARIKDFHSVLTPERSVRCQPNFTKMSTPQKTNKLIFV